MTYVTRCCIIGVTLANLVFPHHVSADTCRRIDIRLSKDNRICGLLVGENGAGIAHGAVRLTNGTDVLNTEADKNGAFAFENVRSGVYVATSGNHRIEVCFWHSQMAPPNAVDSLRIAQQSIVRGQYQSPPPVSYGYNQSEGGGGVFSGNGTSGKLLIGAGIAAAIAIPLALTSDDDDDAS